MHAVFWLGLYNDLGGGKNNCSYCNKSTPTQDALPPHELHSPDYPFQMIVMDYCSIKFTGWVSTFYFPREAVATDLVRLMKEYFATFGVAEHVSSDEGSQFVSTKFKQFLQSWGTDYHKVSSARNPHSNLRAETAVKTAKRMLTDNTKNDGSPDWDKISRALPWTGSSSPPCSSCSVGQSGTSNLSTQHSSNREERTHNAPQAAIGG